MLTIKFLKRSVVINDYHSIQWEIIPAENFTIKESGEGAFVSTYSLSCGNQLWSMGDSTSDQYSECYVENLAGKTVFKWILQSNSI